jgi:WD40 repeat protein
VVAKADAGDADVRSLRFTRDGKTLMCAASRGRALALDPSGARPPRELLPKSSRGYYPVLTPGGKLAVFADDGALRVWDLTTGRERGIFDDHRKEVVSGAGGWPKPLDVALSPDGRRLATRSPGELRLWDARTGRPLKTLATGKFDPGLSWSPDGKALVVPGEGKMGWWSADTGALLRQVRLGPDKVERVALTRDGSKLLCELENTRLGYRLLDARTGKEELRAVPREGYLKAISLDGKYYAATGLDGLWLYKAGAERALWKHDGDYTHIHEGFSPDGRVIVAATWSGVRAWETATGRALGPINAVRDNELTRSEGVCVSPDARTAAVLLQQELLNKTRFQTLPASRILLVETATGRLRRRLPGIDGLIRCSFTPDGGKLLSGSNDQTALVWDVYAPRGRPAATVTAEEAKALWEALGDADGERAFDAVCRLSAAPAAAVAVLRPRLRPTVGLDAAAVKRHLAALGAADFAEREAAMAELAEVVEEAEPLLRAALAGRPAPEVRRRIERLLAGLAQGGGGPAGWRRSRALEALERAGSPEAVRLVRALAGGVPEARLTRAARAALRRLRGRGLAGAE